CPTVELDGQAARAFARGTPATADVAAIAKGLAELAAAVEQAPCEAADAAEPRLFEGPLVELVALAMYRPSLDALCDRARGVPHAPMDRPYLVKMLEEQVGRQFGHPLRPIVELVLNGADASRVPGAAVDVRTEAGAVEVVDAGEGMDARTVLSRLLLPFATDKRPGLDVGRFGVGFFSVLGLGLTEPRGFGLEVETGDGTMGAALSVASRGGAVTSLEASLRNAPARRGTRVRVTSPRLEPDQVRAYLRDMLHFFPPERAVVRVDGVPVNDGSLVSGGRDYEDAIAPGCVARFHLGGRGLAPGATAATFHAGVKVEACFAISELALIDFPSAVDLTEGRDALKPGPLFAAVARAFYRRLADYADETRASRAARHRLAEVAAQISALMLQSTGFAEAAAELAERLLGPARHLVAGDRAEALLSFLGASVAERLFSPESFWAEREWAAHLAGERELLEDELDIDTPEPLAAAARRRSDLGGLALLASRVQSPETLLVSLARGKRRPAAALPCLGTRRAVLVRDDAPCVRAPRGWADLYALRASFDRAIGAREPDVERDLIVMSPLGAR
ncbi:MAG TPA: ATP-binding protein, partial [Minicystis sp.]|nr:ATP-binding protein [Minicystis sp.]